MSLWTLGRAARWWQGDSATVGGALSSTGTFVLVTIVLGVPGTIALFWWSVRYADKRLL